MLQIGRMVLFVLAATLLTAQDAGQGPTDAKAQKTYKEGLEHLKERRPDWALDSFKKADKQDGGHCPACQQKMIKYGAELRDWKTADMAAEELIADSKGDKDLAVAHYQLGILLLQEGVDRHKDDILARAHDELTKALGAYANFPDALFTDGRVLSYLRQDDAARAQFERFVKMKPADDPERQRALRYIDQPELARARMAPAFAVTTLDGRRVSLDDLKGKVVLLDFWATWCGPCREALPHMRSLAKNFQGQPLVILSISLDRDEQKWKDFIAQNGMTWLNYRDGDFTGPVSRMFGVEAIPHTFSIDAEGVLQDEHIGDASIEGKLKKLLSRARELETAAKPGQ